MTNKRQAYASEKRDAERAKRPAKPPIPGEVHAAPGGLQQRLGNRGLQRLIAQRAGGGPTELDDETAGRINAERGGGQALDAAVQEQTEAALGADFSGVRVHTSPEAHALNQQINARAFTTGQDIFFSQGAYQPGSAGGQELIAHELAHVIQQGQGRVSSGGKMAVNPPGDRFEQEADAAAQQAVGATAAGEVQRQPTEEEEEEPLQGKGLQRQEMEDEQEDMA